LRVCFVIETAADSPDPDPRNAVGDAGSDSGFTERLNVGAPTVVPKSLQV
jgi:hypothetical protein